MFAMHFANQTQNEHLHSSHDAYISINSARNYH